ncbi:radical SAM protein [Methylotuvimicrobium sp. KM1]|uniref:radical SAM protein n=1 Tax=Methylotuvimicrobium sp. KM1 TaxID=3377707 RepID=UPI00384E5D5F
MIVFGPVPSRRLGRSLGINNIPPKHCSYSCLYCQVGPTKATEIRQRAFYEPEYLFDEIAKHLEKLKRCGETVDYLTFVPDGEPTLDAGLGRAIELLRVLDIKIAVISNASLISERQVREHLKLADWVSLKVDAVDRSIWQRINRPHQELDLELILSGMLRFAGEFTGTLATETMLLEDINTGQDSTKRLASFLLKLAPEIVYLSIPTRPTADSSVRAACAETLTRVYQTVNEVMPRVELLSGYEGNVFSSTGDFVEDILAITAVHPMRKDAVMKLLEKNHQDWKAVEVLLKQGKLQEVDYEGYSFYVRSSL